jgi:hypothetical protein
MVDNNKINERGMMALFIENGNLPKIIYINLSKLNHIYLGSNNFGKIKLTKQLINLSTSRLLDLSLCTYILHK